MHSATIKQTKSWYQYPLVWMIIFIPFSAVVMGVIMGWLAVDTDDGLVADDYYKQGLAINQVIERDDAASRLSLSGDLNYSSATRVINLRFDKGNLEQLPDSVLLHINHATRAAKDRVIVLHRGMNNASSGSMQNTASLQTGRYFGVLPQTLTQGIWYFEISDLDWRLVTRTRVGDAAKLHFQALKAVTD